MDASPLTSVVSAEAFLEAELAWWAAIDEHAREVLRKTETNEDNDEEWLELRSAMHDRCVLAFESGTRIRAALEVLRTSG